MEAALCGVSDKKDSLDPGWAYVASPSGTENASRFECSKDALGSFCREHGMDAGEMESYLIYRRVMKIKPEMPLDLVLLGSVSMLTRMYRGINLTTLLNFEDCPRYFFVHSTGVGGFFPACVVGSVVHHVPCIDITDGCPIVVIERGGEKNMKAYSDDLFLCSRSWESDLVLQPELWYEEKRCDFPVSIEFPVSDVMYGEKFALGFGGDDGFYYFPTERFRIRCVCGGLSVKWILIARCQVTKQWTYVDAIGSKRFVFNSLMKAKFGACAKGYFVSYSISDSLSVQRDLAGFFNRIDLNMSKGLVFPAGFPESMVEKLKLIFSSANFDFSKVFGVKYDAPLKSIDSETVYTKVLSKSAEQVFASVPSVGVITVPDVVRGIVFDRADSELYTYDVLSSDIVEDIKKKYPYERIKSVWSKYLIDLIPSWKGLSHSATVKLLKYSPGQLTDSEAYEVFFFLVGAQAKFVDGVIEVIETGNFQAIRDFNCLVLSILGSLIYVKFSPPYVYLDFVDLRKSRIVDRGPCFYSVSRSNIQRILSLGFHLTFRRNGDFRLGQ